jgi:hypothetical protein
VRLIAGIIGLPLAARLPMAAPIAPPMTAPTGPATAPTTAPVAAPAVVFEMGGISMFSFEPDSAALDCLFVGIGLDLVGDARIHSVALTIDSALVARAVGCLTKKRLSFPRRFLKIVVLGWLASATLPAATVATSATAAVTATAAAVAATTTIAATAAAITTAPATTAAAAAGTRFTGTRFVHGQWPAFHGLTVEFGYCLLRIGFIAHCDKGKAARFAGEFVLHEGDFGDRARLREKILEVGFGGIEGKISDV